MQNILQESKLFCILLQTLNVYLYFDSILLYFIQSMHIVVSFTNLYAHFGRINWEFAQFELPSILASLTLATIGLWHKTREETMFLPYIFLYMRKSLLPRI